MIREGRDSVRAAWLPVPFLPTGAGLAIARFANAGQSTNDVGFLRGPNGRHSPTTGTAA